MYVATVFIAALFIIVKTQKQPKCPSADEWIKKIWYMYTQWNIAQTLKSMEFCHLQHYVWTWGVLCLVKYVKQRKTSTVWYHLCVKSKKHSKPVNITKKE